MNYIGDFGRVATDEQTAMHHVSLLHGLLKCLDLREALHKASSPARVMPWLGLHFNTVDIMVSIPQEKLQEMLQLVKESGAKCSANLHQSRTLLGKLLHITQCYYPARLFLNWIFVTHRECPAT